MEERIKEWRRRGAEEREGGIEDPGRKQDKVKEEEEEEE